MWLERISALADRSQSHVLFAAASQYGSRTVVATYRAKGVPTLKLGIREMSDPSNVVYGNALSDAIEEALGFRLFGYGLPFPYALSTLVAQSPLLGSVCLTVIGAENAPEGILNELWSLDPGTIRVVASYEQHGYQPILGEVCTIDERDLALTFEEACVIAGEGASKREIESSWRKVKGAYLDVLTAVRDVNTPPPIAVITRPERIPAGYFGQLESMLVAQGRWMEALELALRNDESRAVEVFRRGAASFIDDGVCVRVWQLISRVKADAFSRDDELMYWYFSVATAANEHNRVAEPTKQYLDKNEAPDLRARWAVAFPNSTSLSNAERAYKHLRNVNTARALGFVLTLENRSNEALEVLREALEYSEVIGDGRQMAATALDMSHALTFEGKYRSAMNWAKWGLSRYAHAQVGDELLRLSLASHAAFMAVVVGSQDDAEGLLARVTLSEDLLGVPMTEALVSTRGDLAFVQGDYEAAEAQYRKAYELFPVAALGFAALDLVRVLVVQGRLSEAEEAAAQARSVTSGGAGTSSLTLTIGDGHIAYALGSTDALLITMTALSRARKADPVLFSSRRPFLDWRFPLTPVANRIEHVRCFCDTRKVGRR